MIGYADEGGPTRHDELDGCPYFLYVASGAGNDFDRDAAAFGQGLKDSIHGGDPRYLVRFREAPASSTRPFEASVEWVMHKYLIEGGFPVRGRIKASGNKNAAPPASRRPSWAALPSSPQSSGDRGRTGHAGGPQTARSFRRRARGHAWRISCVALPLRRPSRAGSQGSGLQSFAGPLLARFGKVELLLPGATP